MEHENDVDGGLSDQDKDWLGVDEIDRLEGRAEQPTNRAPRSRVEADPGKFAPGVRWEYRTPRNEPGSRTYEIDRLEGPLVFLHRVGKPKALAYASINWMTAGPNGHGSVWVCLGKK